MHFYFNKIYCFVLLCMLLSLSVFPQSSCASAFQLCQTHNSVAHINNGSASAGPDYGCLQTVPNPDWYYVQIAQSGQISVLIAGQNQNNVGYDVDFICWGPFSSLNGICTGTALTATHSVDCSYSSSPTETLNLSNAIAGQYYMILVTNFSNLSQNILITQISGQGSFQCGAVTLPICAGTSTTISFSNSSLSSANYSIQPGGSTNSTGVFTVTPVSTTNYTIYCTGLDSQNQLQSISNTYSVNIMPAPSLTLSATNQTMCSSDLQTSIISASGGSGYTWSTGSSASSITVSPQSTSSYSVLGTGPNGCLASVQLLISVIHTPTLQVTTSRPVCCAFESVNLIASGASSYSWSTAEISPDIAISPSVSTTYSVTGTTSGCSSTTTIEQVVDACTGIKTIDPAALVSSVYPNPAKDRVIVETIENAQIVITDAIGQTVYKENITNRTTSIHTGGLANGIYFLKAISGNKQQIVKIVKE